MYLKAAKVPLNEYEFPVSKIANVQSQLENLVATRHYIHQSAKDGYRSYLQAYASYSSKAIFDINKLDLVKIAKSFGFPVPPKVASPCLTFSLYVPGHVAREICYLSA
jgi:ATP-dependent RNA helicase DDX18/HAS1